MSSSPISSPTRSKSKILGPGHLRLICLVFIIIGIGLAYFVTIRPILQVSSARQWEETPCVVSSSRVIHSGGTSHRGPSYRAEIVYHYSSHGTPYTSDRYQFSIGKSSQKADEQKIIDQYPAGKQTVCYVNPGVPSEAVIDRDLNLDMASGALGVLLVLLGILGLSYAPRFFAPKIA